MATINYGSNKCHIPTYDDWDELITHCSRTWATQSGVEGTLFTSSNGNSLFLPASGFRHQGSVYNSGQYSGLGFYWTSSRISDNAKNACYVRFNSEELTLNDYLRVFGLSVRAVRTPSKD